MHARHPFTAVERYSATARLFHWLTALLVVVAYIVSVSGPETRVYSALNDFSRGSHELLGMSVFALTLVRLCWRTIFPSPRARNASLDGGRRQARAIGSLCAARPGAGHNHCRRVARRPPSHAACRG
jgi:cytochrome b561